MGGRMRNHTLEVRIIQEETSLVVDCGLRQAHPFLPAKELRRETRGDHGAE